jgi:hypothetical protein
LATSREIEDVPSNFRNFTALTQLIPGMTPNPAASTFEGGQVVANGTPSQQNVYLIDGMYNNDDRLGGSQGTQVRVVLDNIQEYQVLSNQYSAVDGGADDANRVSDTSASWRVWRSTRARDGTEPSRCCTPSHSWGESSESSTTSIEGIPVVTSTYRFSISPDGRVACSR